MEWQQKALLDGLRVLHVEKKSFDLFLKSLEKSAIYLIKNEEGIEWAANLR